MLSTGHLHFGHSRIAWAAKSLIAHLEIVVGFFTFLASPLLLTIHALNNHIIESLGENYLN